MKRLPGSQVGRPGCSFGHFAVSFQLSLDETSSLIPDADLPNPGHRAPVRMFSALLMVRLFVSRRCVSTK
jgi:hypothetical protein